MTNRHRASDSVFVAKSQKGYIAREALFESAIQLIAVKGIHNISISELCTKAGLNRTSFYNYFQTIEELLDELSLREDQDFDENLESEFRDIEFGIRRLSLNILKYYEIAMGDGTWNRFVMEMFANHEPTATNMTTDIKRDLSAAIGAGEIGVGANAIDTLTHLVFATLIVANSQRRAGRLEKGQGRQVVSMLLRAAETDPALVQRILESGPDC